MGKIIMNKNILVTGANGQLGREISGLVNLRNSIFPGLSSNFFFMDKNKLDITDLKAVRNFVREKEIDTIINCAAYTAVDKAESEPELADFINHQAVGGLAHIVKERRMAMVHISTDYVFDGKNNRPYLETDNVAPQTVYGATKMLGERAMQAINPARSIIIRTSWVYSKYSVNFFKTMMRVGRERNELDVVFDQVGTPTYAKDLAVAILKIIEHPTFDGINTVEIYNYSNEGVSSWFDFAKEIMEMAKIECRINPIESREYSSPATRPNYTILNKRKIKETFDLRIPYWKDSLEVCLENYQERKHNALQ